MSTGVGIRFILREVHTNIATVTSVAENGDIVTGKSVIYKKRNIF